ncbi:lipopolysaccharide biosynthesis protein [Thiocystis violacea]|uniref:lipopolysaccharide biosynthesis protein n=1 Tax=Thiocystis violacea TaxID=13725 RepID=UPI001903F60D|nr:lipopolysaccharide biosynthesis protein [Thiocystis violacea]MBK1720270.1 hypothetical protein [Thiocystis violacea]
MNANYQKHYGMDAVRRSLGHFVLGKTFRMVASLTILLVLVRLLPLDQYAVYIAFQALIAALEVLTSIGVQKVLFRFLPELRATGNHLSAYRLLFYGMLFRLLVVSLLFLAVLPFLPLITEVFNVQHWAWLLPWYLVVGYLRVTAFWLSQCLESFLWQKESQYSMAIGGGVTALGLIILALSDSLTLDRVVLAEALGEGSALLMLLVGWFRKWRADGQRGVGEPGWWRENRARAIRYGLWSYLLSQSSLLYGTAPNRLLAAHALSTAELAVLGVADSLMNLARKWVPTRMLMSMVRPVAMARFATTGDFQSVTRISDFVFRVNLILLALPIVVLGVLGPPLLDWITAGRYPDAGYLLMGFLIVLLTQGLRDLLELMIQAIEKNSILFWTNLFQSASLFIALPLFPLIGVWGLVVANFVGTFVANAIVMVRLARQGYKVSARLDLMAWVLLHAVIAGGAGWVCWDMTESLVLTVGLIVAIYGALLLLKPPLSDAETQVIMTLLRKRLGHPGPSRSKTGASVGVEPELPD